MKSMVVREGGGVSQPEHQYQWRVGQSTGGPGVCSQHVMLQGRGKEETLTLSTIVSACTKVINRQRRTTYVYTSKGLCVRLCKRTPTYELWEILLGPVRLHVNDSQKMLRFFSILGQQDNLWMHLRMAKTVHEKV